MLTLCLQTTSMLRRCCLLSLGSNAGMHFSLPLPGLQVLAYPMTLDLVVLADAVAVLHGAESSALLSGFQSIGSQAISSHARIAELAL